MALKNTRLTRTTRGLLLGGREIDPTYWWYFSIGSVVLLAFGLIFFWAAEERYGRD